MGGPSSRVIQQAVEQGSQSGGTAAVVGLGAAALSGMLAMAQIERSANRLVASGEDRPGVRRFAMALVLSITVGTLFFVAALVFAGGGALARGFGWSGSAETIWAIARWPLGVIAAAVAIFATFRFAPYRRLGSGRSVLAGTIVAVVLWAIFSGGLALYFSLRADSGSNPYGPLLAIIALLLWSMLTSLALHLGMSTTAELEGAPKPSDHVVRVPEAPPMREPVGGRSPRDG